MKNFLENLECVLLKQPNVNIAATKNAAKGLKANNCKGINNISIYSM